MIEQKDMLARLLATENLTVVHDNVKTASFNVKDRVLTLPIWNDMQTYTYDHLIGHEVGHALFTPTEEWLDSAKSVGKGFKTFLNVVEDARIEKLIQRRYPGLRRSFIKSYRQMLADGFFGASINEINDYKLIDRLNTYFKCGPSAGVRIDASEITWVNEIENCETWEQVVDVATRLYALAKEQHQEELDLADELRKEMILDDEEGEGEEMEADFDPSDEENDGEGEEQEGEEGKEGDSVDDDVVSETDKALSDAIEQEFGSPTDRQVYNIMMNTAKVDSMIVGYKQILEETVEYDKFIMPSYHSSAEERAKQADELYTKFIANNKKTVNYLVKEFEMKKSAHAYSRQTVSKTGVIDSVLMNQYKYNDDIFRKMTVVPEGKSHGMIMYLDWSGSMARDMMATMEQTLNLVYFCRQVKIPFRVYAFTNKRLDMDQVDPALRMKGGKQDQLTYREGFHLLEFFNERMRASELKRMTTVVLMLAKHVSNAYRGYGLGATPLDECIMAAHWIFDSFKKQTKVDIINTIFLTDGDSHSAEYVNDYEYPNGDIVRQDKALYECFYNRDAVVYIHNPITKKKYRLKSGMQQTNTFLKMYREYTNSNALGFRIMPIQKYPAIRELEGMGLSTYKSHELYDNLKKEKYVSITSQGYNKFFVMAGGKNLETANGSFQIESTASKNRIATAFKRANNNKIISRSLLNEFIKEVA